MDLYFLPLAGSLASRIALYEAGAEARYIEVDPNTKCTSDGTDFAEIYPLALVPLLRLEDGSLLGENAAVLRYIANRYAEARVMIMPSTYETAVERAAAAMASAIFDPSRSEAGAAAVVAALRAYVDDKNATAFPVEAFERVQRDILICFGDRFGERLRRKIERRFGTEVAEVVDHLIMEAVAEAIRRIPTTDGEPST